MDEEDFVPDRRVMAAVYGDGQPTTTTTFVMLDPAGNLVDFLHCPQLRWGRPLRDAGTVAMARDWRSGGESGGGGSCCLGGQGCRLG